MHLRVVSIATLSFLLYEALDVIDELDHGVHLLATLLHIQRADYRLFAATDLSDPPQLLRLYRVLQVPVNPALEDIYSEVDKMLLGGDEKVDQEVCEEVCAVLRDACEGVHDILHDPLEEVHELAAAAKIVDLLDQSCAELLEILRRRPEAVEAGVRDAGESRSRTSAGEEYEVVG